MTDSDAVWRTSGLQEMAVLEPLQRASLSFWCPFQTVSIKVSFLMVGFLLEIRLGERLSEFLRIYLTQSSAVMLP